MFKVPSIRADIDSQREPALGGNQRHARGQPRDPGLWVTTLTNLVGELSIEAATVRETDSERRFDLCVWWRGPAL